MSIEAVLGFSKPALYVDFFFFVVYIYIYILFEKKETMNEPSHIIYILYLHFRVTRPSLGQRPFVFVFN
jgi:hypothetical protein